MNKLECLLFISSGLHTLSGASGYTMKRALIKSKHTWVLLILGIINWLKISWRGKKADTFSQSFLSIYAVTKKKKKEREGKNAAIYV